MCHTNHVKLYKNNDALNLSIEYGEKRKKKKILPRLLSLFFIFVVDGHPDDIVGDETGKCAWNAGTPVSGGSNVINSSEGPADKSGVIDKGRFVELVKLNDDLILSISSNCTGTIRKECLRREKKNNLTHR
jgi:hypothetical protein